MSVRGYKPTKVFTPEQANAMLPLVRAITGDAVQLAKEMIERRRRLDQLTSGRDMASGDPYDDELAQIEQDLESDARQLQEYVDELRQLGVEPKNFPEGLIDFPAEMDGRIVYLCWKYGEPEILYWHDLETGFAGRQPLTAAVVAEGIDEDAEEI